MERGHRTGAWLLAAFFLLCGATGGFAEGGALRKRVPSQDSGGGKSIRLSIRIYGAKKKEREVSFYKSVARQARIRPSGGRSPSSVR
jgi:hypothetical protein